MNENEKENMDLLSVEEAAAYLKFSTNYVYFVQACKRTEDSACKLWQTYYFSKV